MEKVKSAKVKFIYIISFIITLWICFEGLHSEASEFRFVVWGDTQLNNPEIFERIVNETELLKPALVIHVGDMIQGYTYEPNKARQQWGIFKKQISPLSMPFYPTPGNHDITTAEMNPVYGEVWGKDKYYYSFDYENSHFIVLNTFLNQEYDKIPEKEMEWLRSDLEKNKNAENIFISFHSPLYSNKNYDWKSVHNLLKQYPVKAVFTGHSHIYEHQLIDNIHYFCLNTSGDTIIYNLLLGHSHHFLFVTVNRRDISLAVVTDTGIYSADAVQKSDSAKATKYLQEDPTIIIPDPSKNGVRKNVEVPIINLADVSRSFLVKWEADDFRWKFEPCGANFTLNPGEKKLLKFQISGPQGVFKRDELPKLRVDSPFKNSIGLATTLTYYYRLFNPPETVAKPLVGELIIDGKLDEPAWNNIPAVKRLFIDDRGTTAQEETITKVLYDDKNVYVGIEGDEPNPDGLIAYAYGKLPLVFGDDDFEIYFDTNRDMKTSYRLMVNPKGTVLCSGPGGLFSFKFEVKTNIMKDKWCAEFKVPFSEIKANSPKQGSLWGFNIRRHRQQADSAQRDWSKMRNAPYQPQYFGILYFD